MTVLLLIIYAAFISLGLPDSLLGCAWPLMYDAFGVSISSAGIISMIVASGTIVSSLLSNRLIQRLGTGLVTVISVAMTAVALLAVSFSQSFIYVCLWAVPLGLGAGSVDAALNNFVALHYKAAHMNWLHCFWGIGASMGPMIMAYYLAAPGSWRAGYKTIGIIQLSLVAVLIVSLPLWKKARGGASEGLKKGEGQAGFGIRQLLKLPKAKPTLISFFCYCSLEATAGLWGSSFLVIVKGIREDVAAGWVSLFYIGITLGRLLSGFLTFKLNQKQMIRAGQFFIAAGVVFLMVPGLNFMAMAGLFFLGLGCAPIYPSLLHETPNTFGRQFSQPIMGIQMASAYVGSTLMPPLFGLAASKLGYGLFPFFLGAILVLMVITVGLVYGRKKENSKAARQ